MVKPGCSNFGVITANFSDVPVFRIFTVSDYGKNPKVKNCCNSLKIGTVWFYCTEVPLKDADGITSSVDPAQMSPAI